MQLNKKVMLICTPVEGISDVLSRLKENFEVIYLPDACMQDLEEIDGKTIWALFTNPNRSRLFLGKDVFQILPNLQIICTASTGTVHIDVEEAEIRGISVISLKKETQFLKQVTSTAELSFTLMLAAIRHLSPAFQDVTHGGWDCEKFIGRQVSDLKIGVLGLGRLGKLFSDYCTSFGAEVVFYDPYVAEGSMKITKIFSLEEFLGNVDVLSIHIHATSENDAFVSSEFLNLCKDNIVIVNTARGEVVDENAMVKFLQDNPSAFYATDVIRDEISARNKSPVLQYFNKCFPTGNILVTPHIGGMSEGARNLAYNKAVDLLDLHLEKNND